MNLEKAVLAGGCFWCTEAIFAELNGVEKVTSGYIGGKLENPSEMDIHYRDSGHAEAIKIEFDAEKISFADLLEIFWHLHNPTTLNRQDYDVGSQYRSAIFYHNEEQKKIALESKTKIETSKYYSDPIVTEIVPATTFYPAESYHQNFYSQNPQQGYCQVIISPKLQKLRAQYGSKLKNSR